MAEHEEGPKKETVEAYLRRLVEQLNNLGALGRADLKSQEAEVTTLTQFAERLLLESRRLDGVRKGLCEDCRKKEAIEEIEPKDRKGAKLE